MQSATPLQNVSNLHRHQPAPGDAVTRINHSVKNLSRHYLALARLYVKDGAAAYGQQVALGAAGGFLVLLGWVLFVATTVVALAPSVPHWASLGFWTLVHLGVGGFLVWKTVKAFKTDIKSEPKSDPFSTEKYELDNDLRMRGMVP